jgi:hypothetical protein
MKRLLVGFLAIATLLVGCGVSPSVNDPSAGSSNAFRGTPGVFRDPNGADLDCSDFTSEAEAQAFFELAGGINSDKHVLDWDNDGKACEVNEVWSTEGTGGGTTVTPPPTNPNSGMCWVNGYYRKDGTYVKGYWRRC